MAKPILMPQVGQDLDEGKLVEWKVKLGDKVKKGDIVAVVESEKASFEVEAFETGTVIEMLYDEGATTKVLAPLLFVGEEGETAQGGASAPATPAAAAPAPASASVNGQGTDAAAAVESGVAPAADGTGAATGNGGTAPASPSVGGSPAPGSSAPGTSAPVSGQTDAAAVAESAVRPGEVGGASASGSAKPGRSSPLARRLAGTAGIDIKGLAGTGPRGAVVRRDIEKALQNGSIAPAAEARQPAPGAAPAASASPAGGALHRVWLRKGQGDPVVMIHGFGADHNAWRVLAAAAGLTRPILAVDLPGHGRSPQGATTLEAMAAAVAAALAEEGVTAADLVAHSLGAAVAVATAESARFTVRSLFLISPAGLGPDINGEFVAGFSRARSEATLAPWMRLLVADENSIGPAFVRVTAETRALPGVTDAQQRLAEAVFPDGTQVISVRKALEGLAVPVRIVFGAADRIIPARHAAGLPGTIGLHVFPGVGHMPFLEAREPVARLLGEHLRSVG